MSFDEILRQRAQTEEVPVPDSFSNRVEETLSDLPPRHRFRRWTQALTAIAAVLALAVALPNASAAMAQAMGSLPVLGPYLCWLLWGWVRQRPARGRAVNAVGVGLIVYFAVWGVLRNLAPLMGLV